MVNYKELVVSPVVFEPTGHTYNLNGKVLSGVTSMLKRMLFHDKYALPKQKAIEARDEFKNGGFILENTFVNPNADANELRSVSDEALDSMFGKFFTDKFEYALFVHDLQDAQKEYIFMRERMDGARERGNLIHSSIQFTDEVRRENDEKRARGVEPSFDELIAENSENEMVQAYYRILEANNYVSVANEYTVSNEESHASNIDVVLAEKESDGEVILGDFKCTSSLDKEYLSWQLSVYKYFFELQNPNIKVSKLVAFWFPKETYGKPKMVEIDARSTDEVERLIKCDVEGTPFVVDNLLAKETELALQSADIVLVYREMKRIEEQKKKLEEFILKSMEMGGIKKFENDEILITRTLPTTQEKFDSKAFKEENPDLYAKYLKQSNVKGSVRIKLK